MENKFPEYEKLNLPLIAKEILDWWEKENVFEKSVSSREGKPPFVFYEGPPSANGMPGIHHVMSRTIKDLFCRYKTLKGFQVKRKAGWDTHGLPVELAVEKELGITKEDIGKKISIEDYNKECRKAVMKYKNVWDDLTQKMGYWVDLENPYITYENDYIESVWYLLKMLYDKKLLYKGYTIQPYSPAAGTGLSSHELNLPGCYRIVKDNTVVAQFKIIQNSKFKIQNLINEKRGETLGKELGILDGEDIYLLAWTTTPWTLPSNTALAVGKEIDYVAVKTYNRYSGILITVILAQDLLNKYFDPINQSILFDTEKNFESIDIEKFNNYKFGQSNIPWYRIASFKGKDLEGIKYEQLLKFPDVKIEGKNAFKVYCGDFVSTNDGTGIVHIAPTFGSDDFNLARKPENDIPPAVVKRLDGLLEVPLVDLQGRFVKEVNDDVFGFAGEYVKEAYLSEEEKIKETSFQKNRLKKSNGGYIEDTTDLKYQSVDERIVKKLELEGKLFKKEKYEHNYPHCWRTDKPIIYYPLNSWFIKTTAAKERMIELNKTIHWKPEHTGTGRFGEWLNNLQDWNLSRSRYWGIPLPIWRNDPARWNKKRIEKCIGSIEEIKKHPNAYFLTDKLKNSAFKEGLTGLSLSVFRTLFETQHPDKNFEEAFNNEVKSKTILPLSEVDFSKFDFHRPNIDNIIFFEEGEIVAREIDLIDVWFDSGAMPFAQWGAKSANDKNFRANFPADYIAEGVDQTRGWFYTLHAIATLCFDSVAYKNVISNGLVLDKNGQKMSKRLGNVVNPFDTIEKFGADATRWYLITNSQPWDNLKFDAEGIAEVQKKFFRALYNTYAFFALYANIDSPSLTLPDGKGKSTHNAKCATGQVLLFGEDLGGAATELDKWILSELNFLIREVENNYENYEPTLAGRMIEDFVVNKLSNWYVRLNRRRFWKNEMNDDKVSAYQTLYKCLETVAILASPIAPFYCERLYKDLKVLPNGEDLGGASSVHLSSFPQYDESLINFELQEKMEIAQKISSLVLSLRKKQNIRVRQPLQKIMVPSFNAEFTKKLKTVNDLILSEVNVKEMEILSENNKMLVKKIKPNFKVLGPKYGKLMKEISSVVGKFSQEDILTLENKGEISLLINGEPLLLHPFDFEIYSQDIPGWLVASEGKYTVALDITITENLKEEGIAREIVNKIQNIRKDKGLEVTDKILLHIQQHKLIDSAIKNNKNYICSETLAVSLEIVEKLSSGNATVIEVEDGVETLISIEKLN